MVKMDSNVLRMMGKVADIASKSLNNLSINYSNQDWIKKALRLAEKAFSEGEVPVGAIVVKDNRIIGQGYNQRERLNDPTAHAEIIAITAAAGTLGDCRCRQRARCRPCRWACRVRWRTGQRRRRQTPSDPRAAPRSRMPMLHPCCQ